MANHYLYFDGHSSREYFCHIEHKPSIPVPKAKYEEYVVDGRNGTLHADKGSYENVTASYDIYYHGKDPTAVVARAVKQWLVGRPGSHQLADSYDPGFFYKAIASIDDKIENKFDKYGKFTVNFDCDPRHFSVDGQNAIELTNGQVLQNPFQQIALPYLVISGTGENGTLTINGNDFEIGTYADKQIAVDGENQNAYASDGTAVNNRVYGLWPELAEGENTISWSGGISAVTLTPRWWTL